MPEPTTDPEQVTFDAQNPNAVKDDKTAPASARNPETNRLEKRLGTDYGNGTVSYPWVDDREWREEGYDALLPNIKLTEMWHHTGTGDGFDGMDFLLFANIPGGNVVPLYAHRVEKNILSVKTGKNDDPGYWNNGQNPMMAILIDISDWSRDQFNRVIAKMVRAAYPYTRPYQDNTGHPENTSLPEGEHNWVREAPDIEQTT